MRKAIAIGLVAGAVLALSQPAGSAEKKDFFSFIKRQKPAAPAEDSGASSRSEDTARKPDSKIPTISYPVPRDPNRVIIRIPEPPPQLAPLPDTDRLQKPRTKKVSS